jgi:PAS domain S-box-containing protein
MNFFSRLGVSTKYNFISSLLLVALFVALAYSSYRREQTLILKGAVDTARTISRQIVETRDYLSNSVTSEPEHNENLIPQVAATRIALRLTHGSTYYVRQVSLRYRNPDNRPDDFESTVLATFRDANAAETWRVTGQGGTKALRYLMPMVADSSCLTCHGSYDEAPRFVQRRFPRGHFSYGYRVGEVIGAVSVSVPMEGLYRQIGSNLKRDLLYDGLVLLAFVVLSGWVIRRTILMPVRNVASSIAEVAHSGNFTERLDQRSGDEIGELIGAFNELMAELDRRTVQRVESEDRYRNFIEIAQSPIVTFMADGKIVISNQKAEKLFGLAKQELLGQSIFDFMEQGELLEGAIRDYFTAGSSELIGTTTRQRVRDVCGRLFEVEMVISVSQSDQSPMFSAILRAVKNNGS